MTHIRGIIAELEALQNTGKEELSESAMAATADYVSKMKATFNNMEAGGSSSWINAIPSDQAIADRPKFGMRSLETFKMVSPKNASDIFKSFNEAEKISEQEETKSEPLNEEARLEVARTYVKNNLNGKKTVSEQVEEIAKMLVDFEKVS